MAPEELGEQKPVQAAEQQPEDKGIEERVTALESAFKKFADYFGIIVLEMKKSNAKIVELSNQPAATPATKETPEVPAKFQKTGDKKLDKLAEIMASKRTPLTPKQ